MNFYFFFSKFKQQITPFSNFALFAPSKFMKRVSKENEKRIIHSIKGRKEKTKEKITEDEKFVTEKVFFSVKRKTNIKFHKENWGKMEKRRSGGSRPMSRIPDL